MAENTETPEIDSAPPPLTVAEIVAFPTPASLAGWKLTQDTNGGYSFRATIGDIDYIATPRQWEGRTLTSGGSSMGSFATNGVTDLRTQAVGTLETNDPAISRALVPTDSVSSSTSCPAPDPVQSNFTSHPAFLPGVIGGALVLAFVAAAVVGTIAFFVGRNNHGHA